jgi:uncharacterized cofD-like protein
MNKLRLVCIGGGTGQSVLLRSLLLVWDQIDTLTAGGAVTDRGNSTGFYRDLGFIGVGDPRRMFGALATSPLVADFEQLGAHGQKIGNHFICSTIADHQGDVLAAFRFLNRKLQTRGMVWPVTPAVVDLKFLLESGRVSEGELTVPRISVDDSVVSVSLNKPAAATAELVKAIAEADLIILGPGSTYTSVIAALLPDGMREAIVSSRAKLLYICNVSTERGEVRSGVRGHLATVDSYLRPSDYTGTIIDYCLVNSQVVRVDRDPNVLDSIRHITTHRQSIEGTEILQAPLINPRKTLLCHDPDKLSVALESVFHHIQRPVAV